MVLLPVILAGGSGTRLWPLSRQTSPKQFIPLLGGRTPFQDTLLRLKGFGDVASPVVVCNEAHAELAEEQMRSLGVSPSNVILEPVGRNTAPALTLAALALTQDVIGAGDDPLILVMPADHVIEDVEEFHKVARAGTLQGERGSLVTFGVAPTDAETGYGYIRKGRALESDPGQAFSLEAFVEKPDAATAAAYVNSGDYLWNSGMFMMRASVWLETLARHRPDIAGASTAAYAGGRRDGVRFLPDADLFAACPAESIDYAVMEPAAKAAETSASQPVAVVLPLDAGWSDLGSWSVLWEKSERDASGNAVQGDTVLHGVRDSLVLSRDRLIAVVGLDDVVVVETKDAILVSSKDRAQDVQEIVARLKTEGRREPESHP